LLDVTDVSEFMGLGLAPKTAYAYARVIQRVLPLLEARGVDLLTCSGADVAMIAETWPRSRSSRSQLRSALGAAWMILGRDAVPLRAVRVPPHPRMRCKALSAEEAAELERVAWARRDPQGLAVLVGLYLALRREEIASLRPDQFHREHDGLWLRITGKGDVTADLPVHWALERALDLHGPFGEWIFPARPGRPGHTHPTTVWTWVRQVAAQAGLGRVATHRLRHTGLTEMNDRSRDLRTVQELARHTRPETTALYTRVTAARMREVAEMIDYGRAPEAS